MTFDGASFIRHVAEGLVHDFQFSQGAGTPGLIGSAKENPARRRLERLMPAGVQVGSGLIVDSYGGVSKQQDIVIYEALCPVFSHNDSPDATFYPVEGVIAVGEVKSILGKGELEDAFEKCVSVKRLRRHAVATKHAFGGWNSVSYRTYGNPTSWDCAISEQFDQDQKSLDQIYSFLLCQKFKTSPQAILSNFADGCRKVTPQLAPNIVVALENGTIYPFKTASNSITRSAMDGDGAIFSPDAVDGFAQLVDILRVYSMSGRTVDRKHYHRYFEPLTGPRLFEIRERVLF